MRHVLEKAAFFVESVEECRRIAVETGGKNVVVSALHDGDRVELNEPHAFDQIVDVFRARSDRRIGDQRVAVHEEAARS
jgi:hypothetical protein